MAFESLTERLNKAFKNISGQGKLTEKNMDDMLREVRLALLEADVNYKIVKDFLVKVKDKAVGQEVYTSLNPSQMVVKIVHDELVALLGEKEATLNFKESGMTVVMITHFMEEAAQADRVIVLEEGRVACDGTPQDVLVQAELLEHLNLDLPFAAELSLELGRRGVPVGMHIETTTLKEELCRLLSKA